MKCKKKKLCLILEGGGAKCAYQAGVLSVLEKAGYKFQGIGGTSFGAVNGAMYIVGKSRKLNDFWETIKPSLMFNEIRLDEMMEKVYYKKFVLDKETLSFIKNEWKNIPKKHDEVSNMYQRLVMSLVDEDKIRKSKIDFGLVTIALSNITDVAFDLGISLLNPLNALIDLFRKDYKDKFIFDSKIMKPIEVTKDDIPKGKMKEYVAASASLPPFKPMLINDKYYMDGGYYDNTPIKLMSSLGYKKFLVIRTNSIELDTSWNNDLEVKSIIPNKDLGSCAMFSPSNIIELIKLGKKDGLDFVNKDLRKSLIWKIRKVFIRKI